MPDSVPPEGLTDEELAFASIGAVEWSNDRWLATIDALLSQLREQREALERIAELGCVAWSGDQTCLSPMIAAAPSTRTCGPCIALAALAPEPTQQEDG